MAAANRYLTEPCLFAHNRRIAVAALKASAAFIPWLGTPFTKMRCVQGERNNRTDPMLHTPDRVTCYLQEVMESPIHREDTQAAR
jgi:hypothetical protein